MSLFPHEDILTKLITLWDGYCNTLPKDDQELFKQMILGCYRYSQTINAKSEPSADDALFMALAFLQHRVIELLFKRIDVLGESRP